MSSTSSNLKRNLKLVAMLLLLPLAMSLVGVWQLQRANAQMGNLPSGADVESQLAELRGIRQRVVADPQLQIQMAGRVYSHYAAEAVVQREINRLLGLNAKVRNKGLPYIAGFSKLAMVAGAAAMVLGVSGLILAIVSGRLARRSRADLISIFSLARRTLPFLLAGVILLLVLSLAGLTGAEGWQTYDLMVNGNPSRGEMKLYLVLLMAGLAAIWVGLCGLYNLRKAFAAFVSEPLPQYGRAVSQAEAPGLWLHVGRLAERLQARPPQNIVVGLTDGFYVTAHEMELLPEKKRLSGETLYLPLSYVALMRPDEFDAIVGHELGHFSGADTAYSLRFVPMHAGMSRSLALLDDTGTLTGAPARMLGEFLMEQVNHAVMHWSREREFAADSVGKRVAGGRASARALVRSSAVAPVISDFLGSVFRRPEDAPADLLQALVDHARAKGLADPELAQESATPHPTDTHPPTVQRIKALGETLDPELLAEATQGVDDRGMAFLQTFFSDRLALQRQLSADVARASLEHKEEVKAELRGMVEEADPASDIEESAWAFTLLFSLFGLGLLGATAVMATGMLGKSQQDMKMVWVVLGTLVGGLFCLWMTLLYFKRGRSPIMTMGPTGISGIAFAREVPWAAIDDVNMTVVNNSVCTILFDLDKDAEAPVLVGNNLRRVGYQRKKHRLSVTFGHVRGMNPQGLLDKIGRYRRADHARRALAEM